MRPAILALLALAATSASALEAPETVGLHLVSAHESGKRNNQNPGVFAVWAGGETVGVYRNSHRTWSAYAGQSWSTDKAAAVSCSLTLGAVVGYPRAPVLPLAFASARVRITDRDSISLGAVPKPRLDGLAVVHLTAERRF